jgi:hypothetical protein
MIGLDTMHMQAISGDQIDNMDESQLESIIDSVYAFEII